MKLIFLHTFENRYIYNKICWFMNILFNLYLQDEII